ncbi:hypothetical protein [Comamonas koreensis]|uniref:Uncharacterized protein n=1 Tax=Comamonas koreensis TaxID=160825 RepID=A0AAW4XV75_9BURK|nr:hypothetical protein [Comamonas koreensis]MCD2165548.1 hypothetical protein [Comamonas koreensis]
MFYSNKMQTGLALHKVVCAMVIGFTSAWSMTAHAQKIPPAKIATSTSGSSVYQSPTTPEAQFVQAAEVIPMPEFIYEPVSEQAKSAAQPGQVIYQRRKLKEQPASSDMTITTTGACPTVPVSKEKAMELALTDELLCVPAQ